MIDWLRRRICRCPEPEPMIQVTGNTLGGTFMSVYEGEASVAPWSPPEPLPPELAPRTRHLHAVPDPPADE